MEHSLFWELNILKVLSWAGPLLEPRLSPGPDFTSLALSTICHHSAASTLRPALPPGPGPACSSRRPGTGWTTLRVEPPAHIRLLELLPRSLKPASSPPALLKSELRDPGRTLFAKHSTQLSKHSAQLVEGGVARARLLGALGLLDMAESSLGGPAPAALRRLAGPRGERKSPAHALVLVGVPKASLPRAGCWARCGPQTHACWPGGG